jgi:hypothetical protein
MDTAPHEVGNRLVNHAVPGNPRKAPKAFRHHAYAKVPALSRTRMPDVQRTLVVHENLRWSELPLDRGANACDGIRGHGNLPTNE